MHKKKAMSSKHASQVKIDGHKNEKCFASLINGKVNQANTQKKKDVIDVRGEYHSVKGGMWWQIFLYGIKRLKKILF